MRFFASAAEAEAAGYRACKRCRPEHAVVTSPDIEHVRRACEAIRTRSRARWSVPAIARAARVSVTKLRRAFRATLGVTPHGYVSALRRRRFLDELRKGSDVTKAIYEAGYGSSSRVYGALHLAAMTPATYGRGGRGATIEWSTVDTAIGHVLVGATRKGLCFVEVGRDKASLVSALRDEYPHATIGARPSSRLAVYTRAAAAAASTLDFAADIPVDVTATAFQWRVWRALTRIPRGTTVTYGELARTVGAPSAARAVARACATNPLALLVPCHRVVGADGNLRGYRWGVDVKKGLLTMERKKTGG